MRKINCIIVDDEPLAREGLAKYVHQVEILNLAGLAKNATEAHSLLHRQSIDVMFLDIEMPQLSGLNFLDTLPQAPWVVFTTAYAEFALEGYRFNTVDYLVKPISFERFLLSVNKTIKVLGKELLDAEPTTAPSEFLFIKVDKQLIRLPLADIFYIEGMQNYIAIYTQKERFVTMLSMKNLFDMLPTGQFLQAHKSYIVAKDKVGRISENELVMGTFRIPLSRRMREEVIRELIGQHGIRKGG